jgi:hypothetical protein
MQSIRIKANIVNAQREKPSQHASYQAQHAAPQVGSISKTVSRRRQMRDSEQVGIGVCILTKPTLRKAVRPAYFHKHTVRRWVNSE